MRRLIATSLLLFALFGTVVPLAQALTAAPPHACCMRKGPHHCHEAGSENPSQPIVRETCRCSSDCCRAVTSTQWAQAQPSPTFSSLPALSLQSPGCRTAGPATAFSGVHSSRGPPVSWNSSI